MFKVRDHVRAKAGGPLMVVERAEGRAVGCLWFEQGLLKRKSFAIADLAPADARDAGVVAAPDVVLAR